MSPSASPQAILVFPRLRVQNANAVASPLTHGFPSITAFAGLMWALERKLAPAGVALHLHGVGVVCHHHQEQVTQGHVRSFNLTRNPVTRKVCVDDVFLRFNLTRNPVTKDGSTAAIVQEGRVHLEITLVLSVSQQRTAGAAPTLVQGQEAAMQLWADTAGRVLAQMRVAGGSLLPPRPAPGRRVRPWLAVLFDDAQQRQAQFRQWRRQWLPGYALVGRDDLLAARWRQLRAQSPDATLLDTWLHAARFNREPDKPQDGHKPDGKLHWADPWRGPGNGWIVPIAVGYAALSDRHAAGAVHNARDAGVPLRFVESVHTLGQWISPHRLTQLEQLLWHAETDEQRGLYRCRNRYAPETEQTVEEIGEFDYDDDAYAYT